MDGSGFRSDICQEFNESFRNLFKEKEQRGREIKYVASLFRHATSQFKTSVCSWGEGKSGCLGLNSSTDSNEPCDVFFLQNKNIQQISAGYQLSLFLLDTGEVYQSGRVKDKVCSNDFFPTSPYEFKEKIASISAGYLAGYAISEIVPKYCNFELNQGIYNYSNVKHDKDDKLWNYGGVLYSWGSGFHGQLGHGDTSDQIVPKPIYSLLSHQITQVSAGLHFVLAKTLEGQVFSWGVGNHGQLGHGDTESVHTPRQIMDVADYFVQAISAGEAHSLAIIDVASLDSNVERTVFSWGRNLRGCLGVKEDTIWTATPTEISFFRGHLVEKISAGTDHSLVLSIAGTSTFVYSFGGNQYGQLGTELYTNSAMPRYLSTLKWTKVVNISAGSLFSLALTASGELYSWGDGTYGKTIQVNNRTTFAPWKISKVDSKFLVAISAGRDHGLAIYRRDKTMSRRRCFKFNGPATFLTNEELQGSGTWVCYCEQSGTCTPAIFGLYFMCEDCSQYPVCHKCIKSCHQKHSIKMLTLDEISFNCSCSTAKNKANCKFTKLFNIDE